MGTVVITFLLSLVLLNRHSFVISAILYFILKRPTGSYMVLHLAVVVVVLDKLEDVEVSLEGVEVTLGDVVVVLIPTI